MEQTSNQKVKFIKSLKAKIFFAMVILVIVAFFTTEIVLLKKAKQEVTTLSSSYLLQISSLTGKEVDEKIAKDGTEFLSDTAVLSKIFDGVGIDTMDSSYMYMINKQGKILYHPSPDKIGTYTENSAAQSLVEGISNGMQPKPGTMIYEYNGKKKIAAYYITSGAEAIVIGTVDYKQAIELETEMIKIGTFLGVTMILFTIGLSMILANSITKPLVQVSKIVDQVCGLDLRTPDEYEKLKKRNDEVGLIAKSVGSMVVKIREVVTVIKENGDILKESSDSLAKMSRNATDNTSEIERAIFEISESTNNQSAETQKASESVIIMGNMVEETNKEVETLSDTAGKMKQAGDNAAKILSELEKINDRAKESINIISTQTATTNESANKIREVTAMIADIAEETNLLSLNASIEAARAGEQGRGFAVVAGQIQKLAEQSNESTRTIEEIINSLITDSDKAVETMSVVQEIMSEQDVKVNKTAEIFGEVINGIGTSIDGIGAIAEKTAKLDEARSNVVDVVSNLSAIAEENAASTEETSASVSEVAGIITNVSDSVDTLDTVAKELSEKVDLFIL